MPVDPERLIRPMFEGPVDLIGDVHGEIDALRALLKSLGYDDDGDHPENRRIVLVGDLVDRGPDAPAVLRLVRQLVGEGRAQCVLGNHELSVLRNKKSDYNFWFHQLDVGDPSVWEGQTALPDEEREVTLAFLRSLPIALERKDLRVVHACWHDASVDRLRELRDPLAAFLEFEEEIEEKLRRDGVSDRVEQSLAHQNGNPIKVLTSGIEERVSKPAVDGEHERYEARVAWWDGYDNEDTFCVFGHYSRTADKSTNAHGQRLFPGSPHSAFNNTMCIDYGVGGRAGRRRSGEEPNKVPLVALRWPERVLYLDVGESARLIESIVNGNSASIGT